jgi:hypothetical protein
MSVLELLEEAFALPWEVDVLVSPSCREKEVSSSGAEINQVVCPFAPAKSLIWRGFLGPRAVSPPSGGVEGDLAGAQGEGSYYGGWVLLCLLPLCR